MIHLLQVQHTLVLPVPQDGLRTVFVPTFPLERTVPLHLAYPKRHIRGMRLREIQINLGQEFSQVLNTGLILRYLVKNSKSRPREYFCK